MNYHDTVPTQPGRYWTRYGIQHMTSTTGAFNIPDDDFMLGPLPTTQEEAISLACEVAFARMAVAWNVIPSALNLPYLRCYQRFTCNGERSLSLLRDMERVTGELTKK